MLFSDEQPQDLLNLSPLSDSLEGNRHVRETLPSKVLLPADKGDGMQVSGAFLLERGNLALLLTIQNNSPQNLSDFAMQFNVNVYVSYYNNNNKNNKNTSN